MAPTRMMSEIDFTKTQLAVFWIVLMLAVDSINPVKIFLHVFPQFAPWHVASLSIVLMLYVFISELKEVLYFSVKVFFHSILSIFFREVDMVGRDNIPRNGPVIFTSNHANQFIDSVVLLCTCSHKISYLIAEKSWNRRIIGDLAWAMGCVPVKRAQDSALAGSGTVTLLQSSTDDTDNNDKGTSGATGNNTIIKVVGESTMFTNEVRVGYKLRLPNCSAGLKVIKIDNDTLLQVDATDYMAASGAIDENSSKNVTYDILKRVDQKKVYEKVLDCLANRGAIGIFPEGGSHDRTDLLPLKVGVALIAYSALERDGMTIPIVPVGLNYFNRHRFRGRVVVEFGSPVYIDPSTLKEYKQGGTAKHKVCNDLLTRIEDSMRSVIVSTPDYHAMKIIHAARRLYQPTINKSNKEKQDMAKRFAIGYKQLLKRGGPNPPKEWIELQTRLNQYQTELDELGIRDYQVPGLAEKESQGDVILRGMKLPYHIAHLVFLLILAAVPAIFLNLPVGLVARLYSNKRRKKALAASRVKVYGYDVMLSEKVLLCIVLVPTLWITYGLLLFCFTNFDGPAIALSIGSMPVFSYIGIMAAEAGMVDWKDVRPFVIRLFPSARRRLTRLPQVRLDLQHDLRKFIRSIGPQLGEIYHGKQVNWAQIEYEQRQTEQLQEKELISVGEDITNK